jgi:DNA repair exonuclease SbcCD nuclease subunit
MKDFIAFSDLHLNKFKHSRIDKNGNNELFVTGLSILDQIFQYAKVNKILDIIFLGDLFHVRDRIDSEIYCNTVYDALEKYFGGDDNEIRFTIIPGNHDQIDKQGNHTLNPYSKISRIAVINKLSAYDNNKELFCPHQYDITKLYEFLNEHSNENSFVFMHQLIFNSPLMNHSIFRKNEAVDSSLFKFKYLFSGHNHRPFVDDERRIYNIGSPMHYDFGDAQCPERFFIHYISAVDKVAWIPTVFPAFAMEDTEESTSAVYIKKKQKKIDTLDNRTEINFSDNPTEIVEKYVESSQTELEKPKLCEIGSNLLRGAIKNVNKV